MSLPRRTPLRSSTPLKRTSMKRGRPKSVDPLLRAAAIERDRGCRGAALIPHVACWGRLDPHHPLARGMGGTKRPDRLEDLITLCRAHHDYVETHRAEARELGLLRLRFDASAEETVASS